MLVARSEPMSVDLYQLQVLDLAPVERRVRLRVLVDYYDIRVVDGRVTKAWAEPLPRDASFFFCILWGANWDSHLRGGPIGEALAWDQIHDIAWVNANTARFVERVQELSRRNDHPSEEDWQRLYRLYELGDPDDDREVEEQLVQADYDLWVTEQRWMAHLTPWQSWGTAAFPMQADGFQSTTEHDDRWSTFRTEST
jgi:hypothetical protein